MTRFILLANTAVLLLAFSGVPVSAAPLTDSLRLFPRVEVQPEARAQLPTKGSVHTFGLPISEAVPLGITVQVISQSNGRPVPGATVMISRPYSVAERFAGLYDAASPGGRIAILMNGGQRFTCNENGETRIPYGWAYRSSAILLAAHGQHAGIAKAENLTGNRLRIAISLSKPLRVLVRNQLGDPVAGIPVAIQSGPALFKLGNLSDLVEEVTDRHGMVTLPYARCVCKALGAPDMSVGKSETSIRLVAALGKDVSATIDLQKITEAPFELTLPETRKVRVRVRTKGGQAAPAGTQVYMATGPKDQPRDLWYRTRLYDCDAQGDAVIPYVGSLERWRLSAIHPSIPAACVQHHHPSTAKELAESIDLLWDPQYSVYSGSIQRADGSPAKNGILDLALRSPGQCSMQVALDSDGRFSLPWPSLELHASTVVLSLKGVHPPERCFLELPKHKSGPRDLGEIKLLGGSLVAKGVVRTSDGKALPGARVFSQSVLTEPRDLLNNLLGYSFASLSDSEGKFAIYSTDAKPAEEFIIAAEHPSFPRLESAPLKAGSVDVKLTIQNTGSLRVAIQLPEGFRDRRQVAIELEAQDELPSGIDRKLKPKRSMKESRLHLSWPSLPMGKYDLHVALTKWGSGARAEDPNTDSDPDSAEVASTHSLRVLKDPKRGAISLFNLQVPHLATKAKQPPVVDLSSVVRVIEVSILDQDQKPAAPAMVIFKSSTMKLSRMAFGGMKKKAVLFAKEAGEIEVQVQADGFDSQTLKLKDDAVHALLRKSQLTPVELYGEFDPEEVISLSFSRKPKSGFGVTLNQQGKGKPLTGTVTQVEAGTYEVELIKYIKVGQDRKYSFQPLGKVEVTGAANEVIKVHMK